MYFYVLTWASQFVNAMTPDHVSGVWRQATPSYENETNLVETTDKETLYYSRPHYMHTNNIWHGSEICRKSQIKKIPIGSGDYTDLLWWNNINN